MLKNIWNQLDGIRYGIWDSKTNSPLYMDTDIIDDRQKIQGYIDTYGRILTPDEVLKYKIGTCWDITLLVCYLATKDKLSIDAYYYECKNNKDQIVCTHIVPAVQYKNKWYLIEHVYDKLYGIHECNSVKECWKLEDDARVKQQHICIYKNTNFVKSLFSLFHDKNITIQKILDITGTMFNYKDS